MTTSDVLNRCTRAVGLGIGYRLGAGGMDPTAPTPAGARPLDGDLSDWRCDCSGAVAWALGISRLFAKRWINTDEIVRDAQASGGLFSVVAPSRVGDVVVYGRKPPNRKVGHVGIVMGITAGRPTAIWHCSKGNERWTSRNGGRADAILVTGTDVFRATDVLYARFHHIEDR